MSLPIACTLSEPELRERRATLLAALGRHIRGATARADGYALALAPDDEAIVSATAVIQAERKCCAFLRFTLTVGPGGATVELALTGGPGTREMLAPWLAPHTRAR
jgi:hypothetical protein